MHLVADKQAQGNSRHVSVEHQVCGPLVRIACCPVSIPTILNPACHMLLAPSAPLHASPAFVTICNCSNPGFSIIASIAEPCKVSRDTGALTLGHMSGFTNAFAALSVSDSEADGTRDTKKNHRAVKKALRASQHRCQSRHANLGALSLLTALNHVQQRERGLHSCRAERALLGELDTTDTSKRQQPPLPPLGAQADSGCNDRIPHSPQVAATFVWPRVPGSSWGSRFPCPCCVHHAQAACCLSQKRC